MASNQTQIEISAVDKTRAAFDSVNQSLGKIKTSATSVNSVLGAFGAALSVGAFVSFTKNAFAYADSLGEVASANEIAVSKVLELNKALIVSGGSSESAGNILAKFSTYIQQAVDGSEDARAKLQKLGVSLDDLKNKSFEDLFDQVLEGMAGLDDRSEKTATKLAIFGKAAKSIDLKSFNENLKAVKGTQEEYSKSIEEINVKYDNLGTALSQIKLDLAVGILDALKAISNFGRNDTFINQLFNGTGKPKSIADSLALFPTAPTTGSAGDADRQKNTAEFLAKEAEAQLAKAKKEGANRQLAATSTDKSAAKEAENYIDKLKKQIATFGEGKAATLEYEASQIKLSAAQKAQSAILLEQIKAQEDLAEQQKRITSYTSDLSAIFALNAAEKTSVSILQDKLNLMTQLPEATRAAAEAELELARAAENFNSNQTAQNIGIDNEVERMNELYEAEKEATDERNKVFADSAETLKRENEDLNVALITSDRARARAQNDLEYQRSIERINTLVLEGDQAQELIDAETKNYELRKQQIEQTNNITKELGLTFTSAFENAVVGGQKFSGILKSLADDIAKLILRKKVTEPLFDAVSEGISGSGINEFFSGLFGGFKASGGSVDPSKFYVVGEQGPELFVPSGAGSIMPNSSLGGSAQNNNISIVVNADGSDRQESGNANDLSRRLESAVRAVLVQEKRPGGLIGA